METISVIGFPSGRMTVKAIIRPLEDTDHENLARLRTLVRPHSPEAYDADWQASIWRWLESHPLADEMHRWVLEAEGEIVGHLAALPQCYRVGGQRVVAHTPADYMVLPEYGFHAITLMRKLFRACENCVACDTAPAVIGVETRLGAQEAGKLQFGIKLWDVSGVPSFPTSIPLPVTRLFNRGLRAVDRALDITISTDGLRAEVTETFDETFDELFDSVAAKMPCVSEKDATFLRWRYGPRSPQGSATILCVREEGSLLGYAVLWLTREGHSGYLLDLTTLPGRRDVAGSLLRESIRHFRRLRVHSVRYRFIESPTSPRTKDLWRLGFFLGNKRRSTLLVKFADSDMHKTANDAARWSYSFGDGEATFWVS